jgi:hypothetical protein
MTPKIRIWCKYICPPESEMARIEETKQNFSTGPRMFRTRTQMGELDLC